MRVKLDCEWNDRSVYGAISEGVCDAFTRLFSGITDAPSHDFWDTLKEAITSAFEKIADETIDRKSSE